MLNEDNEVIILVDDAGNQVATAPKLASHHANTPLHLAFSVYIFNDQGQILATQRALSKKVWPGVWTNSCCGHLSPGESTEDAIHRRVKYELGIEVEKLKCLLPDYRYKTPAFNGIIENEICPVYFATTEEHLNVNHEEVESYKWMEWKDFTSTALGKQQDVWSWWCKDQLKQLQVVKHNLEHQNESLQDTSLSSKIT